MTRRESATDRELGALLRAADPAAIDPAIEAAALARLARRVERIDPRRAPTHRVRSLLLLPAAAALVAAVLLLGRGAPREASESAPSADPVAGATTFGSHDPLAEPRQLQFETPGGTRVVWLLDPNLSL